ncbi:FlgD immunoglobulin-like domain containing protein [Adhaeribacter radiodurans]|uniref:T9SS type A sorting domain-containing protein n=1 Tax=Adhaeribacter radiodurans TaxID=2745197 RepID=A0A7L7L9V4_9BACT|nr:FlgD immunoglobulin-like domain containing protein [Adhaeribacter radiodurans]QMU29533.1 T9SS type A sorting domain-containing protein [Adhaeribacter radiodurans]
MKTHLPGFNGNANYSNLIAYWFWWSALVLVLVSYSFLASGQNKVWDKTIGSNQSDGLAFIEQTKDGGYIVGGTSDGRASGDKSQSTRGGSDYWIIKLKADGTKAWDKTFGGQDNDNLTSLHQTQDGGYILGGTSESGIGGEKSQRKKGESDYWVVKLKADGTKAWDKTYGGSNSDNLRTVQQTNDGGYILGGSSTSDNTGDKTEPNKGGRGNSNYWVVKLNATGDKEWDKTIGSNESDTFITLQQTIDNCYILGGNSYAGKGGDKSQGQKGGYKYADDLWIVKLKSDGNKEWDKTIGGSDFDYLGALQQTQDGGYILGGSSDSDRGSDKSENSNRSFDYWVVKLDASGGKIWDKTVGGNRRDYLSALQQTKDGGYILGGYSDSDISGDKSQKSYNDENNFNSNDYWIVKLNATGTFVWDKTIGGNKNDYCRTVHPTSDGGYIIGGTSPSGVSGDKTEPNRDPENQGGSDFWVVKLGNQEVDLIQSIQFKPIIYKTFGDAPFTLSATASSGLPVSFTVESGPATIKETTLSLTGIGQVTVKATQAGNTHYKPITATQTFLVQAPGSAKKIWDKSFGGNKSDNLNAIVATTDGGYLLGGFSSSENSGDKSQNSQGYEDYWIIKTNATGSKLWDKRFGGTNADHLTALLAAPDGGYLLGGYSRSGRTRDKSENGGGVEDYWVIKIDSLGNKLWDKTFGGIYTDKLSAMVLTLDGGYLLGGSSNSRTSEDPNGVVKGYSDYWVIKIDATGNKIWDKTYGGDYIDDINSLLPTPDGGYLLGGSSGSNKSGDKSEANKGFFYTPDYWLVKIDGTGKKLWDKTYGGESDDNLKSLIQTPDGGYLLGGSSSSNAGADKSENSRGSNDYWVVKIDKEGIKLWDKTYGGNQDDNLTTLLPHAGSGYILAGSSFSDKGAEKSEDTRKMEGQFRNSTDYWIVKINENGEKDWDKTIGGSNGDNLTTAVIGVLGNYVLGGYSWSDIGADKSEPTLDKTYAGLNESGDYWIVNLEIKDNQLLETAWNMRYGGSGTDNFTSLIQTPDGGYLSGGYTNSGNNGDKSQNSQGKNDYWIVKSDKNGKKLWDKRYGGNEDDFLNRIIQTMDGGYLLAGSSLSGKSGDKSEASKGNRDFWLVKIDKQGTKEWDKSFGGSGYDELKKVVQLSNGNYIMAGSSNSPASGDKSQDSQGGTDYWIVKINATGDKIWDKRFGGNLDETLGSFSLTSNNSILLGGTSLSGANGDKTQTSRGGKDFWLVQLDSTGAKTWDKRFGGPGDDELFSMGFNRLLSEQSYSAGDYFVGGASTSGKGGDKTQANQGGKDFWLVQLHSNGNLVRDLSYGGSANDELRAAIQTQAGDYVLAGTSFSGQSGDKTQASKGGSDYWLVKIDAFGNKLYDQTYGGSGNEELRYLQRTSEDGFVLGGRSNSDVSGDRTQPSQGGTDYWLMKVAPAASVFTISLRQSTTLIEPDVFTNQVQVYPNPFTDLVTISLTLAQPAAISLQIYTPTGQQLRQIDFGVLPAGKQQLPWNGKDNQNQFVKPGLYLYRTVVNGQLRTGKLFKTE